MAITLATVIAELQFINSLNTADPSDKRLAKLVKDAQDDLVMAAQRLRDAAGKLL